MTDREIPEPDLDDPKEVYAFFGLAMYWVQVFEHSVTNLAAGLRFSTAPLISKALFDSVFQKLDQETLGGLLTATRSLISFPSDIDKQLTLCLKKRNYLTHRFFKTHSLNLLHSNGRELIIYELKSIIEMFIDADEVVTPMYYEIWKKFGIDEEWVEQELQKALKASDEL